MFIVYAVAIGLLLGHVLGGRLSRLASIQFHWPWLAIGGFLIQLALFSDAVSNAVGYAGPAIYVGSTFAVLVAVLRNVRLTGLVVVAAGAGANLAAIVANGGFMPASAAAVAALGGGLPSAAANPAIVASPALEPLTDLYAMPGWLPLASVFSVGDVLIAVGVVVVLVSGMRRSAALVLLQATPMAPGLPPEVPRP